MKINEAILSALKQFDPTDTRYWTDDGLPVLEAVQHIAQDLSITREMITAVAPGFSRTSPSLAEGVIETEVAAAVLPAIPGPTLTPVATENAPLVTTMEDQEHANATVANDPHSRMAHLQEKLQHVRDQVEELNLYRAELQRKLEELYIEENGIDKEIRALGPRDPNSEAIRQYLNTQNAELIERGKRVLQLRGFDLKSILGNLKSPLDASLARKNTRGTNRPAPRKV